MSVLTRRKKSFRLFLIKCIMIENLLIPVAVSLLVVFWRGLDRWWLELCDAPTERRALAVVDRDCHVQ